MEISSNGAPEEGSLQSRPGRPCWSAAPALTPPPPLPAGLPPPELPTPPEMMQTDLPVKPHVQKQNLHGDRPPTPPEMMQVSSSVEAVSARWQMCVGGYRRVGLLDR